MKYIILFIIYFLHITCIAENRKNLYNSDTLYNVGGTYDSMSNYKTKAFSCLKATDTINNIVIDNQSAIINFTQEQDLHSVQNALGIDLNSQIDIGFSKLSIKYHYGKSTKEDEYTLNINYIYKFSGVARFKDGILIQGKDSLSSNAQKLLDNSPESFRDYCGDSYIAELDAGVSVLMRLSLKFDSLVEKNYYTETFNKIGGLSGIISRIKENSNVHFNLTVSGLQLGGKNEIFNNLFLKYHGAINKDGYPTLSCGSENNVETSCVNLISEVINYAKTVHYQLESINDYNMINPVTVKWKQIGIDPKFSEINPEILKAMSQILKQYHDDEKEVQFLTDYKNMLNNKHLLSQNFKDILDRIISKYNNVFDIYHNPNNNLIDCFNGYITNKCLDIRTKVLDLRRIAIDNDSNNKILKYLTNNIYLVNFYIDNELNKTAICLFSPISEEEEHLFMINCNGQVTGYLDDNGIKLYNYQNHLRIESFRYNYNQNKYIYYFNKPLYPYTSGDTVWSGEAVIKLINQDGTLEKIQEIFFVRKYY